jgi:hypothetical protein
MTLPSLVVPAPTRRTRVFVNRRLHLGVRLDFTQVTYDYDAEYGTIHIRALRCTANEPLARTMRQESGVWLLLANVDADKQTPEDVTVDLNGLADFVGSEAEVTALVLEAIAIFYDSDELAPLHRRTLRAFYRELTYVTTTSKV